MTDEIDGGVDQEKKTWTSEEIEEWEAENEGVCPAFRVDHRPERESVTVGDGNDRLMLHHGERGPVELEIWHEGKQEATHITTQYSDSGSESKDITRELRRAGYELVEVDDAE